mmetsp:Transcript_44323/g.125161  ORF Transcript_44323/g.125161 Transcript_44323/m.125161 type:complete len:236 (+) Transcript_44323:299-1006(+)
MERRLRSRAALWLSSVACARLTSKYHNASTSVRLSRRKPSADSPWPSELAFSISNVAAEVSRSSSADLGNDGFMGRTTPISGRVAGGIHSPGRGKYQTSWVKARRGLKTSSSCATRLVLMPINTEIAHTTASLSPPEKYVPAWDAKALRCLSRRMVSSSNSGCVTRSATSSGRPARRAACKGVSPELHACVSQAPWNEELPKRRRAAPTSLLFAARTRRSAAMEPALGTLAPRAP